jgi:SAM-dependent methyltransferase
MCTLTREVVCTMLGTDKAMIDGAKLDPRGERQSAEKPTEPRFVRLSKCWICGESSLRPYDEAILNHPQFVESDPELAAYTGTKVPIVRCGSCGFGQPATLPSLPRYFDRMYALQWPAVVLDQEFNSSFKDLIFNRILDGLTSRLPPGRRSILDVGAYVGRFVRLAAERGMAAEGIELNPPAAAYAARATGLPIHQINAHELAAKGRRYDAVAITDVLEHIPEPLAVLERLRSVMAPDGWLAVKVPHGYAQWLKEHTRAMLRRGYRAGVADNLIHVNQFGVRSLRLALERAGYRDIHIEIGAPNFEHESDGSAARRMVLDTFRRSVWQFGRLVPGGVRSPLALNLQAFARNP